MAAKRYRILEGRFLRPDGTTATVGDDIEIPDDLVARNAHRLELIEPEKPSAGKKPVAAADSHG